MWAEGNISSPVLKVEVASAAIVDVWGQLEWRILEEISLTCSLQSVDDWDRAEASRSVQGRC